MLAATLLLAALAAQTNPEEADVTVTARKLRIKPIRDAISYFERHCFDASRLTGQPSAPLSDRDWHPLSDLERSTWGIAAETRRAFGSRLSGEESLALTLSETAARIGGRMLAQFRCTLIVTGGDHRSFADRVASIFKGAGTQKHVGDRNGLPAVPGWHQLLWASIPAIGSADWRVFRTREASTTWVQVIDPAFYQSAEYVVGDFRTRTVGTSLTKLTLIYTRRLRPADGNMPIATALGPRAR